MNTQTRELGEGLCYHLERGLVGAGGYDFEGGSRSFSCNLNQGTAWLFPYRYHVVNCTSWGIIHSFRGEFDHYVNK